MLLYLTLLASWGAWIAALNGARWQLTSAVGQALAVLGVLLVVRPTVLVLGLDVPFPDELFTERDLGALLVRTQVVVLVFLGALVLGARLLRPPSAPGTARMPMPSDARLARLVLPLAGLAAVLTLPYLVRYGGLDGLTEAAKTRALEGSARILRVPALAAAYLGVAVAAVREPATGTRPWLARGATAYLVGALASYAWGSRDAAVFPLLLPVVAALGAPRRLTVATTRRALRAAPRVLLALALIVGSTFTLRALRDVSLTGSVQRTIAGQALVRQVAVATNNLQYDALLLVVDDTPDALPRGGADIVRAAALTGVPAFLRRTPADFTAPAVTVAQHYQPTRINGWPLSAAGDWYYALGLGGAALGGLASGLAASLVDSWRRRQRAGAAAATGAVVLVWGTTIAPGGLALTSPGRVLAIAVPFLLLCVAIRLAPLGDGTGGRQGDVRPGRPERRGAPPLALALAGADQPRSRTEGRDDAGGTGGTGGRADQAPVLTLTRVPVELEAPAEPEPAVAPLRGRAAARAGVAFGRVRSDFALTMAANVLGVVAGLLLAVVGPRALGRTEFGRLSWALGAVYLGGTIATLGAPLAVVALAGRATTARARRNAQAVALDVTLLTSVAVGAALATAALFAPHLLGRDFDGVARVAPLLLVPTGLLLVASAALRSSGRFGAAMLTSEQITRSVVVVGLLLALAIGRPEATFVVGIAGGLLLAGAAGAFVALGLRPFATPTSRWRPYVRSTRPYLLGTVGTALIPQSGVLTLGLAGGADEVATFAAAVRLLLLCSLLLAAATRVVGPRIAHWRGSQPALDRFLRNASTLVFWATFVQVLPILVLGPWLVPLLFGRDLAGAYAPAAVLLVGLLVNAATGCAGQLLYNAGHEAALGRVLLVAGLAFLPLGYLGGVMGGAVGVAAVATAVVIGLNAWQVRAALRLCGVRTWAHLSPSGVGGTVRTVLGREAAGAAS